MTMYTVGQRVKACGRSAVVVQVFEKALRVRYLEPSELVKALDLPFSPCEANVPKSYVTVDRRVVEGCGR